MGKLLVKQLHPDAKLPTVANPGEDLGYDIYAIEDTFLEPNKPVIVKTGIAAIYADTPSVWPSEPEPGQLGPSGGWYSQSIKYGLEVEDRSGMAAKNGIHILAGKIDAGYRGEIGVVMVLLGPPKHTSEEFFTLVGETDSFMDRGTSMEAFKAERVGRLPELVEYFRVAHGSYPAGEGLGYQIKKGDKIAQMQPREVLTTTAEWVDALPHGARGDKGYGSSGR